ncbi:MAG: hypothetical protein JXE07_00285 [Candidatus Aminicenantes bacterium]|nr:hypothetical protein [Candidatus Aminicenantes bacterium]
MKFFKQNKRWVFVCGFIIVAASSVSAQINPDVFAGLKARSIGPANMSGRIAAVEGVDVDPDVLYVGAAAGGVWKSTDAGTTWTPIFDDQPVASIGSIAVYQKNPNIIWVGTGESKPRNSVSVGRGIYLSLDAGKTWKLMGLEKTEKIAKVLIHPDDPDVVFVAALGATWGDSVERGVFKTVDGGKTWKKILYVNEKTGAADMTMDPTNPNKILVAMWEHRRWPWFFVSGGPGSGIYITSDGGEKWDRLTEKNGLPSGDLGRCGLVFAPHRPKIVYALVEAKKSVVLRSEDGGWNWQVVNSADNIHNRPFYYSRIFVNPRNENTLYMLASQMSVSEDGGKTFRPLTSFGQAHSDFHAMWIGPDGERLVVGNDGGVVISFNRGQNWRFVTNLPVGQFYHVNYDLEFPYNIYGGLQDNGTWRGPAYTLRGRSLGNYDWISVGGGDGFDAAVDPENPNCGYGMSQGGNLYYFDVSKGTSRAIMPTESDVKHRYDWNAGFAADPFKPATIYLGSQFLHRSPDKGLTWEIISPDLTTNDPEKQKQAESGGLTLDVTNAENYCTMLSIAPSPLKEGMIWVGTDDGNVQLTRDAGKTWELVSAALTSGNKPLVPAGAAVPHIEPSHFDEATAYVVFEDHMRSNFAPYVFVTRDYGKTWKSLATPQIDGYCFVVKEDTVNRNLLFVGTEFGLFVSLNGGSGWMKWIHGLPTCPVYDLAVHPRENDLIIATHGRSLYVVDDITPLREISDEMTKKKLHVFSVPDAIAFEQGRMSHYLSPGDTAFSGDNKQTGACISYCLIPSEKKPGEETEPPAESPEMAAMRARMGGQMSARMMQMMGPSRGRVTITILDAQGRFISELKGPDEKGVNRVFWNLREAERRTEEEQEQRAGESAAAMFFGRSAGVMALPGQYTAKVQYEGQEISQKFEVKTDPRIEVDIETLTANYEKAKQAQALSRVVTQANRRLQQTQRSLQTVKDSLRMSRDPKAGDIRKAADALEKKRHELTEALSPTPPKQGIADRSAGLQSRVMGAVRGMTGAGYVPITQAAQVRYDKARAKAEEFIGRFNAFFETDVEAFKKMLKEAEYTLFPASPPLKLD